MLPVLLAISANSPFLDGADTGLASVRSQIFTRTFPRCGIHDPFGDWETYAGFVELLARTSSIVESTQLWWSIRPHHAFGTVEVRICDAQSGGEESFGLAGLMIAAVAQACSDYDDGVLAPPRRARELEENLWRAIRHGLDGRMIDFDSGSEVATAAVVEELLAWTEPGARPARDRARRLRPDRPQRHPAGPGRARAGRHRDRRLPGRRRADGGYVPRRGVRSSHERQRRNRSKRRAGSGAAGGGEPDAEQLSPEQEQMLRQMEEEMRRVRVQDLVAQSVVSILNLSYRRIAKEDERDLEQARVGIEAIRGMVDALDPEAQREIRNALSQVQVLYAQAAGEGDAGPAPESGGGAASGGGAGGAPESGGQAPPRLWTPGSD